MATNRRHANDPTIRRPVVGADSSLMGYIPNTPMPMSQQAEIPQPAWPEATTPIPTRLQADISLPMGPIPETPLPIKRPKQTRSSRFAIVMTLLVVTAIILLTSIGAWGYFTIKASKPTQKTLPTTAYVPPKTSSVTNNEQAEITNIGQQYMNAFLQQNYDVMWSMLHPQAQAMWPSQQAFAAYLQAHFQGYTLQSFSSGDVVGRSYWVNPETMVQYNNVDVMPISLHLAPKLAPAQLAKLAPQFQQPSQLFQNLPLVVQRVNDTAGNRSVDSTAGDTATHHWLILSGGPTDQESPILPPGMPLYKVIRVPILMYHHISDVPTKNLLDFSLTVTGKNFTKQLDYLQKQGYHSITLNQLMNALYYGAPLPTKPIILTFDDGYDDAYTFAYPILKAHGYSGMFYIITGKVGWKGQASWDQLRTMLANGMQMGSHTVRHVDMGSTYLFSPAAALREVQISQAVLQKNLDIPIQHFCYPNGGPFKGHNVVLQQKVVALLAANGYVDATTDPGPTGIIQSSTAPFVLLRLRIDGRSSFQFFVKNLPYSPPMAV